MPKRKWNWQQKDWPQFGYDSKSLEELEASFLRQSGVLMGVSRHLSDNDKTDLTVDMMSDEALTTSEIEGEYLNRDSVRSSICRQLGLKSDNRRVAPVENGIAEMMAPNASSISSLRKRNSAIESEAS
jgi:Fic family protein